MTTTLKPTTSTATSTVTSATTCAFERPATLAASPTTEGYIHSVETCGTVDGPGLRYVLFLHGCPLRCQYCHNPDSQGKPAGETHTAEEAFADVLKYKSFIRKGGLTLSGGEPLMQPDFVEAMFTLAKEAGIHTTLDTSGFVGHKASDALLDKTDLVLLDIKSFSPMTHKVVTGVCVDQTLKFAQRLDARGNKVWIRFVLVPGLTDNEKNIDGLAQFVSQLGNVERVEILPFHKMGEEKYKLSGLPYKLANTPTPTPEAVDSARAIFARHGVVAI
ncbi:pyruvate formate-lyase-activating protein [Coraliomargarita sp. SDUM461004]|uniref:Pyruvate formate-lyase-activating enzyme n=1 Tax=Thalassobacterium sedimentorum TaxID=3041258 RepID=A0ABU1AEE4_9BACT|nr:pyruvate formate-lyase-activating protein [Coraliomargarita sp. SDUM461004]MDQ8192997.1 pyruvate formate-lyase-activating protein [Coraliomargarita sp. SDUM461004]